MLVTITVPTTHNVGQLSGDYTIVHASQSADVQKIVNDMQTIVNKTLGGVTWVTGLGSWTGDDNITVSETVHIAQHYTKRHNKMIYKQLFHLALTIAVSLNQWCVLVTIGNRAVLVYQDGKQEIIGD